MKKLMLLSVGLAAGTLNAASTVTVSVDASKVKCEISPWLYGTGMEDVNHEIYGGLDAQRLYGESFEESVPSGVGDVWQNHGVSASWDKAEALDGGDFVRDAKVAHWGKASQSLLPQGGVASIANSGLRRWGVPCRAGKRMVGRIWTRGKVGRLEVALQDAWGEKTYAVAELPTHAGTNWCEAAFALTPSVTDAHGRFLVRASGAGQVWLDDAYLADEPTNEVGRLGCREDIVAAFRDEGVTFLRWGGSMVNTPEYKLKNMNGTGERRPYAGFWYREASGGFGPYEFVRMAQAMKLPCSVAINAYDTVEDAVRFATETKRFDTPVFVQIGNEELVNWAKNPEDSRTMKGVSNYCAAVRRLVPAMRAANPKLRFIQSAMVMGNDGTNLLELVFRAVDGLVDYWDVHVGVANPEQVRREPCAAELAREMLKKWNPQTTMKVIILEENGNNHGLDRALAHAVMLEKARAMGPDMLTSCPANALQPYLHNDNWWDQGAIFFTPTQVWLSPCGQAQKLASSHHRELLVEGTTDDRDVSVSATKSRDGKSIVLHFVNTARSPRSIDLKIAGADGLKVVEALSLSGATPKADNSPAEPLKVAPRDDTADFLRAPALRPYSYTVLTLERPRTYCRTDYKPVLGDRMWVWGHDGDSLKEGLNYNIDRKSHLGMKEAADFAGIPNVAVVRWKGLPKTPFGSYFDEFPQLRRFAWGVMSADDQTPFDESVRIAMEMCRKYPNLTTLQFDDYFVNNNTRALAEIQHVRDEVAKLDRKRPLSCVYYEHNIRDLAKHKPQLDLFDEVSFWTWKPANLKDEAANVRKMREALGPERRLYVGVYLWDYDKQCELAPEYMRQQLETTLGLIKSGVADGLIVCASYLLDTDYPSVKIFRDWVKENANTPVPMPLADFTTDRDSQVVLAEGTETRYEGHPTMVQLEGGRLIAVWCVGHGGGCGPAAESTDGGKTWTRIDDRFPAGWRDAVNCPSIYELVGPDGKKRLWIWAQAKLPKGVDKLDHGIRWKYTKDSMPSVMSEDGGKTWREMPPLGPKFRCVMGFCSIIRLKDGSYLGAYHVGPEGKDAHPLTMCTSVTRDGGFTWSEPQRLAADPKYSFCEASLFRSQDGNTIAMLARENHRTLGRSGMTFSTDEGKTWSEFRPTSWGLTGDRHTTIRLRDGRYFVAMRDAAIASRTWGQYVAWVGTWESLVAGKDEGAMRLHLLNHRGNDKNGSGSWDTGYSGVAQNADGTVTCVTYMKLRDDACKSSVVATRITAPTLSEFLNPLRFMVYYGAWD